MTDNDGNDSERQPGDLHERTPTINVNAGGRPIEDIVRDTVRELFLEIGSTPPVAMQPSADDSQVQAATIRTVATIQLDGDSILLSDTVGGSYQFQASEDQLAQLAEALAPRIQGKG